MNKEDRRKRDFNVQVADIPMDKIKDNPHQPRKKYNRKYIKDLASSISERGLLHPVSVVIVKDHYVIVGGHCRFRAFKTLRRKTIPAIIRRESSKKDMALDLAIENALRKDFSPIEKSQAIFSVLSTIEAVKSDVFRAYTLVTQVKLCNVRGIEKIKNSRGNSVGFSEEDLLRCEKLLKLLGISENTCTKYLRLIGLPKYIQDKVTSISSNESISKRMIQSGYITVTMAYELSRIENQTARKKLYEKAVENTWNAMTLRAVVDEILENGTEQQINKLGSSKRRGEDDYGMSSTAVRCFNLARTLKNFRVKIPMIALSLDKIVFRTSLVQLKKGCEQLLENIGSLLDDEAEDRKKIVVPGNETIKLDMTKGANGQKLRFSFPKKQAERIGVEAGDKVVLKVDSVIKAY